MTECSWRCGVTKDRHSYQLKSRCQVCFWLCGETWQKESDSRS